MRYTTPVVLALAVSMFLPVGASGAAPKLRACGNTESGGVLIGDITTKRVKCPAARRVAREAVDECGTEGPASCQVRGFSCLAARATEELRLARCSKPRGGRELYRVIRFDYGS